MAKVSALNNWPARGATGDVGVVGEGEGRAMVGQASPVSFKYCR